MTGPGERVSANVALQMHQVEAGNISHLVELDEADVRTAGPETVQVVEDQKCTATGTSDNDSCQKSVEPLGVSA